MLVCIAAMDWRMESRCKVLSETRIGGRAVAPGYRHLGLEALFEMARNAPISLERDRFLFIRHGETDGNKNRIFQRADQPLNARGLQQAEAAADVLRRQRIEVIRASTMPRAFVTAEILGRPHSLKPEPHDGLRERWFGDLVGTPAAGYDWRDVPPNGETLEIFVRRTQAGLSAALQGMGETAVVAHGGTLYVLGASLGIEIAEALYANATPLLFERRSSTWTMTALGAGGESGNIV